MKCVIFFDTADTLYRNDDFESAQEQQPIIQLSQLRNISLDEAGSLFKETRLKLEQVNEHVPKVAVMKELGVDRLSMQEFLATLDPQKFLTPDQRLQNLLRGLSTEYELGIITNVLNKFLVKILSALAVDIGIFKYIVSVDNTSKSKPNPESFLKAIDMSGRQPNECVYVGDSLMKDIKPAKRAGMKTVWVNTKKQDDQDIDVRIDTVYEVEAALKALRR